MTRARALSSLIVVGTLVVLLAALSSSGGKANSVEASGPGGGPPTFAAQNIPGRYIVVLQPDADVTGRVAALEAQHGFRASHVYQAALKGFAATLPDAAVAAIRQDPDVIL